MSDPYSAASRSSPDHVTQGQPGQPPGSTPRRPGWWRLSCAGALATLLLLITLPGGALRAEPVTVNLRGAELSAVIATVAEATGKNFIIDPRISGKVTVVTGRPLERDELYQLLLSILAVHGYVAVPSGNAIKIVPSNAARYTAATPGDGAAERGDAMMTQVFSLRNVTADKLVSVVRPLISPNGHLAEYLPSNMLIVYDTADNIVRLGGILERIDQPATNEVEVIPLHHASAVELVEVLGALEGGSRQGGKNKKGSSGANNLTIAADERTNTILISGDIASRLRLRATIAHLDTPVPILGNTKVIYLRYAKAEELAEILNGMGRNFTGKVTKSGAGQAESAPGKPATASSGTEVVNVQSYVGANALVITAPPDLMAAMDAVILKLDIRRAQVKVEAVIAEISADKSLELGVRWGELDSDSGITVGQLNLEMDANLDLNLDLGAMVSAHIGNAVTNVLSTPTLVTLDNHEAEIMVGQNVPFITGSYASSSSTSTDEDGTTTSDVNPFQTIERHDVGIRLKILPQINAGAGIRMEIEQEASSINQSALGTADVVTNTRQIKTTVIVDDGQILVLGGLITDDNEQNIQRLPLLGSIPVLGNLFSYRSTASTKSNLMVFIRPSVIWDASGGALVSREKYGLIRDSQLEFQQPATIHTDVDGSIPPLLPELPEVTPGAATRNQP